MKAPAIPSSPAGAAPSSPGLLASDGEVDALTTVLDAVSEPVAASEVTLTSGRRYEMTSAADGDRLVIRGRAGEVVLRITVTDEGPILSFSSAVLELSASRRLNLSAEDIAIEAKRDLTVHAGGSMHERVLGDHHLRVEGDEQVEAANVAIQANVGGVGVRAMEKIALDGEHIGLNDDPAPQPFPWSAIAGGPTEE